MQETPADVDEAIRLYDLSLRFAPDYAPALNGLIAIYAARLFQPERALPLADRLLESQPEATESWVRYAGVNLMVAERLDGQEKSDEARTHYERAMEAYEEALRRDPTRGEIYAPLGSIYQRLGLDHKLDSLFELWGRRAPEDFEDALDDARAYEEQRSQSGRQGGQTGTPGGR
jgi:tetratricopeptide (TPR) repeat protein